MPAELHLNLWALLGCVVLRGAVGALWYSPLLFLKSWMKMAKVTEKQMQKHFSKGIVADLLTSLLLAFVLGHAIRYAGVSTLAGGLFVGLVNYLGFVMPVNLASVLYELKPWKYFFINAGYQLLTILAMSLILTRWG